MTKFTWDHIHLRTTNPEAMAAWFEKMLGAEVIRTVVQGAPRVDLKVGGADVFIMPVKEGDRVLFTSYAGNEVTVDGEELLIMTEDDILAVVE